MNSVQALAMGMATGSGLTAALAAMWSRARYETVEDIEPAPTPRTEPLWPSWDWPEREPIGAGPWYVGTALNAAGVGEVVEVRLGVRPDIRVPNGRSLPPGEYTLTDLCDMRYTYESLRDGAGEHVRTVVYENVTKRDLYS